MANILLSQHLVATVCEQCCIGNKMVLAIRVDADFLHHFCDGFVEERLAAKEINHLIKGCQIMNLRDKALRNLRIMHSIFSLIAVVTIKIMGVAAGKPHPSWL